VLAMTRQLAMEGGKHNIRANTISPGLIETGATREFLKMPEFLGPMMDKLMLGRRPARGGGACRAVSCVRRKLVRDRRGHRRRWRHNRVVKNNRASCRRSMAVGSARPLDSPLSTI